MPSVPFLSSSFGTIDSYSSITAKQSQVGAAANSHTTIELDTGMTNPRGKVNITPVPMAPTVDKRLSKYVGAVGAVPHATQAVVRATGALPSPSSTNVCGAVGVTP